MDLEHKVKEGLQDVLQEFFTDLEEIEVNNFNLTSVFSNKNVNNIGEPLLREILALFSSKLSIEAKLFPQPLIPMATQTTNPRPVDPPPPSNPGLKPSNTENKKLPSVEWDKETVQVVSPQGDQ